VYDKVLKLSDYDLVSFINLVNSIFEDYVVPIKWDVVNFELDLKENSLSLEDSFVFFENDNPVGFILNGIRKSTARIDAMGVIKEKRGTGLANYILEYSLEQLKWKNINKVILEVAENDKRAVKFYLKNGFKHTRYLRSLILSTRNIEGIQSGNLQYDYKLSDSRKIRDLALEAKFLFERLPNWQREPLTLLLSEKRYKNELIIEKNKIIGYLVWGTTSPKIAFIVDFSPIRKDVKPRYLLFDLLKHIYGETKTESIQIMNVPENDIVYSIALDTGFSVFITQIEMERKLH